MDAMTPMIEGADDQDIGSWLSSVRSDPVAFVEGAFAWGEGELAKSFGPEPWQLWLLEQIRDGLMTPGQAVRIAIASGHGVGKSAVCSWITLWAMSTAPDTRGIVTASSEAMLMTRYRAELRTWFRRFRAKEYFAMGATSLTSADPGHEQTRRVDLLPFNENRPEAFAGLHNKGRRILVIFDEASAIAPVIWETLEAAATDADAEVIWICCGNPLHPEGRFKDCFDKYRDTWITRHISSLNVSFTNKAEFARWARDYGEDSDFYRTRVLGEFPKVGSDQFISPAMVDEAMQRELDPSHHDQLCIGVDVARYGSDESVIFPRKGRDCRSIAPQVFRGLPLDQLEDRVVMFMNAHPECRQIFVDGTGLGAGLVDHLIRRGYHVTDVQFASKPTEQIDGVRYSNQRCHIWGQLRHHLRYLCLPQSPALKEQLCAPMYEFNRAGEIQLESKEMLRRRGIPSGDLADALCCTYAGQISTLPVLDSAPRGVPWDYNPFDDQHMRPPEEPFVDRETGYQFRLKRWDNDGGFSIQDFQDAAASDALRIVWDEPQE